MIFYNILKNTNVNLKEKLSLYKAYFFRVICNKSSQIKWKLNLMDRSDYQ